MAKDYIITAESIPDLDDWGWDDYWTIQEWMKWHKEMKKKDGIDKANIRFLKWWHKQTSLSSPIDAITFDSEFRAYAKKNKFYKGLFDPSIVGKLVKVLSAGVGATDTATDIVEGATAGVSEVAKGLPAIGKIVKTGVPILIITAIFGVGWWAYNTYISKGK